MSYTNGNEYIIKSMNGIKTYDDGGGTIIEDGEITTTTMTTNDINCLFTLRAPSIITDSIGSSSSLTLSSPVSTLFSLTVPTQAAGNNTTNTTSTAFVSVASTLKDKYLGNFSLFSFNHFGSKSYQIELV